jgi:hypothetical protein
MPSRSSCGDLFAGARKCQSSAFRTRCPAPAAVDAVILALVPIGFNVEATRRAPGA